MGAGSRGEAGRVGSSIYLGAVEPPGQHPNNPPQQQDRTTAVAQRIGSFGGSADMLVLADDNLGTITRFDSRGRHHASGPSPTVAVGAAAGTGATATIVGDDTAGTITVTTGTTPAAGALAVVTFAAAWAAAPPFVILTPKTAAAAGLGVYASSTTTTLTIGAANLPTASTVYSFDYQVVGGT